MNELSSVVSEINDIKACSRAISDLIGRERSYLPTPLYLKMKEIKKEYDERIPILLAKERDLINKEVGEDASSWLEHHGFVFEREACITEGEWKVLWYRSDYLVGRISFRNGEWSVKYHDIIGRFRDIVGGDFHKGITGSHPASVVYAILNQYKDGLNKMMDRTKEALDMIKIFDTKYTIERVHSE